MTELRDHEFELGGYAFGGLRPMTLEEDGFDPGAATWRTQDGDSVQGDGMVFGRDYLGPPLWTWSLGCSGESEEEALAILAAFSRVWRADETRREPGAVLPLRYRVAGRTRRVYGRPRRLAYAPTNRILDGWLPVTCDFQCADHLHYDDEEQSASVAVTPSSAGGLTSPLMSPLSTVVRGAESTQDGGVVGGDAPTWALVTFTGPVSDPYVEVNGWHCGLRGALEADEVITVDPRPWARSVLDQGGTSRGGRLDRQTYLDRMQLRPGSISVVYGGGAEAANSTVTVRWRSASYAL